MESSFNWFSPLASLNANASETMEVVILGGLILGAVALDIYLVYLGIAKKKIWALVASGLLCSLFVMLIVGYFYLLEFGRGMSL